MAGGQQKLAELLIEFALTGDAELRDKMKVAQAELTKTADVARLASTAFADRLGGALKNVTQVQAQQIIKTELARLKLRELTEQVIKYGTAVVENVQRKALT